MASTKINLPVVPTLTYPAFEESATFFTSTILDFTPIMKPQLYFINDDRLRFMFKHKLYDVVKKVLLSDKFTFSLETRCQLFILSSRYGQLELLKILVNGIPSIPTDLFNDAVNWSSAKGHEECINYLLENPDYTPNKNGLRWAAALNYTSIVLLLDTDMKSRGCNNDETDIDEHTDDEDFDDDF
ncbi:hypothetical protein HDV02_002744 [Globomyces sp. JEL0801]|nr:hypothetical protein HDV02_002744 [Globomyces sp. JEL0801]